MSKHLGSTMHPRTKHFCLLAVLLFGLLAICPQPALGADNAKHTASIDKLDSSGRSKLLKTIEENSPSQVAALLAQGASPNVPDRNGNSPLIYSTWFDDIYSAKALLEKGADVNYASKGDGTTALMHAAGFASDDLIKLLIDKGADVNATNPGGGCALGDALAGRRYHTAEFLIEHGADPNFVVRGKIPLLVAVIGMGAQPEAVKLLCKHGAKVDATVKSGGGKYEGKTVVQIATEMKKLDLVKILQMNKEEITGQFENSTEKREDTNVTMKTTGYLRSIEGNRIQFEMYGGKENGKTKVLVFDRHSVIRKRQDPSDKSAHASLVVVNDPSRLPVGALVNVEYPIRSNYILRLDEGEMVIRSK